MFVLILCIIVGQEFSTLDFIFIVKNQNKRKYVK
jgi:hypothetical protein